MFDRPGFGKIEDYQNIFDNPSDIVIPEEVVRETIMKKFRGVIVHIIHALGHIKDPYQPVTDYEKQEQEKAVSAALKNFPHLHEKTEKEIIDFVFSLREERVEVASGQELAGVYCDVEGTILVDGKPNQEIISMLKDYADQGKQVTLWTDGNTDELQQTLSNHGINYPLKRKADFAGAIVEIVIDDLIEHIFTGMTKICAKQFVRACRI